MFYVSLLALLHSWTTIAHAADLRPLWTTTPAPAMSTSPYTVAHSADGKAILVGGGGYVEAWSSRDLERLWKVDVAPSFTRGLAPMHHSPALVVGTDDGSVDLHDLATGRRIRHVGSLEGWVTSVAVSADDRYIAAVSLKGELSVWRTGDGKLVHLPPSPAAAVRLESVAFTHAGATLLVAGNYGEAGDLLVVDMDADHAWIMPPVDGPGRAYGQAVSVSPDDGTVALGYWGGSLDVRDLNDGRVIWSADARKNWSGPVQFSPDGRKLVVGGGVGVRVYDAGTGEIITQLPRLNNTGLSVNPTGRELLVVFHAQARLLRYGLPNLRPLDDADQPIGAPEVLAFSPDGRTLAIGARFAPNVIFRDTNDGSRVATLDGSTCVGLGGIRFDRTSRYVLLSSCDYEDGLSVRTWPGLRPVPGLQHLPTNGEGWFTADSRHLIVMDAFGYGAARVYPIATGKPKPLESIDPRWLDPRNTEHADVAQALWGHRSVLITHWLNQSQPKPPAVTAVVENTTSYSGGFSEDGSRTVRVWGSTLGLFESNGQSCELHLPSSETRSVAISPDGQRAAVGFADGVVRMYTLPDQTTDPNCNLTSGIDNDGTIASPPQTIPMD